MCVRRKSTNALASLLVFPLTFWSSSLSVPFHSALARNLQSNLHAKREFCELLAESLQECWSKATRFAQQHPEEDPDTLLNQHGTIARRKDVWMRVDRRGREGRGL